MSAIFIKIRNNFLRVHAVHHMFVMKVYLSCGCYWMWDVSNKLTTHVCGQCTCCVNVFLHECLCGTMCVSRGCCIHSR